VTIGAVAPKGPAQRAGLRAGDRIVGLGTAKIDSLADLRRALAALKPGDKTTMEIRRDGKAMSVPLEIAALRIPGGD
jgi:S1-C subfamily serine protease